MTIEATRTSACVAGRRCAAAGGWIAASLLICGAALAGYGCAGASKTRRGDSVDVSGYPKDIQDAYEVFAVRCSRCHTLARPLNARIHDEQHWERYVARMRRNPSSGINESNAQVILRFLLYYMHQKDKAEGELNEDPGPMPAAAPSPVRTSAASSDAPGDSAQPVDVAPAPSDQAAPAVAPERNP